MTTLGTICCLASEELRAVVVAFSVVFVASGVAFVIGFSAVVAVAAATAFDASAVAVTSIVVEKLVIVVVVVVAAPRAFVNAKCSAPAPGVEDAHCRTL